MRLLVDTTHVIMPDGDEPPFALKVDPDKTVQIRFAEAINDNDSMRRSSWMGRDDLLALRRAINRALRLL